MYSVPISITDFKSAQKNPDHVTKLHVLQPEIITSKTNVESVNTQNSSENSQTQIKALIIAKRFCCEHVINLSKSSAW